LISCLLILFTQDNNPSSELSAPEEQPTKKRRFNKISNCPLEAEIQPLHPSATEKEKEKWELHKKFKSTEKDAFFRRKGGTIP
jgi:hypothetical protein